MSNSLYNEQDTFQDCDELFCGECDLDFTVQDIVEEDGDEEEEEEEENEEYRE